MSSPRPQFIVVSLLLVTLLSTPTISTADERMDRLPEQYKKWLEQEVVYIITPRERDAFLDLQVTPEYEAFINAFWQRRDPDPLTPVNEFKEEHYRRFEFANSNLGRESAVPGWMTDRGKMLIILGDPDDRETFLSVGWLYPSEVWFYQANDDKLLPPLYLLFFRDNNAGPYRLFNHLLDQPEDLMPSQPLDPNNSRYGAYDLLRDISPDLAHATITMRADQAPFAGINQQEVSSLDFQALLSDIYEAPFKKVDTSYVDAAENSRGLVETEYLFNYIPNTGMANILPGPGGASFVHYSIEIEPQHMTMAKDGNSYYTRFELRGEVTTTENQEPVYQFVKEPFIQLTESQFREVHDRPFSYRDMFPLASGDYQLRVILKNQARNEYTVLESEISVPEIPDTPYLGNPVLLYNTEELADPETANTYRTYQIGSMKLDPNNKLAYVIGGRMLAYVPVVHGSGHQLSYRIVGSDDPTRELDSKTVAIAQSGDAPIVEEFALVNMVGGRYRLVVDLLDPAGEPVATRSADFTVTPRTEILRPWIMRESINGEETGLVLAALAEQYLKQGRNAEARDACERALEHNPNLAAPRVFLGRFYLDEKQPVETIKLLEPAYAQNKENVQIILTLGDAHFEVKNFERAVQLYESALTLQRPGKELLNALAVSYTQLGNSEKAIQYFERSLDLDPEQQSVKELVEKLKSGTTGSRQ